MSASIVATKLYIPPLRSKVVLRPRLIERLNEGMQRKLTLLSASAGSGKTTLVSEWIAGCPYPAAWLSLDEGDHDPARFLMYLVAALQTVQVKLGEGVFALLQSPQPPSAEAVIAVLLNEVAEIPEPFVLVLDDYHVLASAPIDKAVAFLIERMPPHMHLFIATREDPSLPLARLRVRNQLTEVRAADLRFNSSEAAEFLGQVMGLDLSEEQIGVLESRTEGWIAGLQLAALSMQGQRDPARFIDSFSGNHPYVLDYLLEEVLQQQSASTQAFLLHTSILDRLCGSLCDAVLGTASGQDTLEQLERANLFIVPLDGERRWYRYHHLFADLLRKRLQAERDAAELHIRASIWHEENLLELEAFQHAVAAKETVRAARLAEGEGMPLLFRGAVVPVRSWLESLPREALDARPSLWVMHASALLMAGQMARVEEKLQGAEKAMQGAEQDERNRDLIGHIASIRATQAVSRHQAEIILAESRRALEYLHPDNLPVRTATVWTMGYAHQLQGERLAAGRAYAEALAISERIGHVVITIMATLGIGHMQQAENQLDAAAETYRRVLQLAGDPPMPVACEAHLGLARIFYERNDLDAAAHHGKWSVQLARQLEHTDRVVAGQVFLARLELARGEAGQAAALAAEADRFARQQQFLNQMPAIAEVQVLVLLHQGNLDAASQLAQKHNLPISEARVRLAQGKTGEALKVLESLRGQAEAKGWEDQRLKVMVLQAVALHAHRETLEAVQLLRDVLAMAEPGGFIRTFVDEGVTMRELLREATAHERMPIYLAKLLAAGSADELGKAVELKRELASVQRLSRPPAQPLIEPLSVRELEVLRLIAQGLSNREISERLFIALPTVKGHNRVIFDKLQVGRRTEAVARARELGLL